VTTSETEIKLFKPLKAGCEMGDQEGVKPPEKYEGPVQSCNI